MTNDECLLRITDCERKTYGKYEVMKKGTKGYILKKMAAAKGQSRNPSNQSATKCSTTAVISCLRVIHRVGYKGMPFSPFSHIFQQIYWREESLELEEFDE